MSRRSRTQQHENGHGTNRQMSYLEARIAEGNTPAIQELERIEDRLRSVTAERERRARQNNALSNAVAAERMRETSEELNTFRRNITEMFANAPLMRNHIDLTAFDNNPRALDFDIREAVASNHNYEQARPMRLVPQAIVSEMVNENTADSIKELKQVSLLEHLTRYIGTLTEDPSYSMRDCCSVEGLIRHIQSVCSKQGMSLYDVIADLRNRLSRMERPKNKPDANRVDFEL